MKVTAIDKKRKTRMKMAYLVPLNRKDLRKQNLPVWQTPMKVTATYKKRKTRMKMAYLVPLYREDLRKQNLPVCGVSVSYLVLMCPFVYTEAKTEHDGEITTNLRDALACSLSVALGKLAIIFFYLRMR